MGIKHCSFKSGKDILIYVDYAKGKSRSRLYVCYVALTRTSPTSAVITSSICSCVLFVGLDNNSSRFDLLAVNTSPSLVINDTTSPKQLLTCLSISHFDHQCVLEFVAQTIQILSPKLILTSYSKKTS